MNTSYGYDAYKAHDLNIAMRTSSGDVIKMDFSNEQSVSMRQEKSQNGTKESLTFSSMQSFQFSMQSNGIDAQDKKEIDAYMKIAQPFIDEFLKELDESAPKTPVNRLAHEIAEIFLPTKEADENTQNYVKTNIVEMFDKSMEQIENIDRVLEDAQKLLEKILEEFDDFNTDLYA